MCINLSEKEHTNRQKSNAKTASLQEDKGITKIFLVGNIITTA